MLLMRRKVCVDVVYDTFRFAQVINKCECKVNLNVFFIVCSRFVEMLATNLQVDVVEFVLSCFSVNLLTFRDRKHELASLITLLKYTGTLKDSSRSLTE